MRNEPLRIGLLVPHQGPAGIWAPSCEASAVLAVAEINSAGGILGRDVELILADAGDCDQTAAIAATDLVECQEVEAVVGMVTSSARTSISRALQFCDLPFIYTPQFEGNEHAPNVVTLGETAFEMQGPGFSWLRDRKRAERFYLIGNDYKWPLESIASARQTIKNLGAQIVGDIILPWKMKSYEQTFKNIVAAQPHVVVTWLLGHEAIAFNRAFAEAGLGGRILRFNMAMDETILYAIGGNCSENLFATASYFSNWRSANNDSFLERYHTHFGAAPPPANGFGQSLYEGFYCLAGLADAGGSLHTSDLQRMRGRAKQKRTARGYGSEHAACGARPILLVTAEGHDFRVINTS